MCIAGITLSSIGVRMCPCRDEVIHEAFPNYHDQWLGSICCCPAGGTAHVLSQVIRRWMVCIICQPPVFPDRTCFFVCLIESSRCPQASSFLFVFVYMHIVITNLAEYFAFSTMFIFPFMFSGVFKFWKLFSVTETLIGHANITGFFGPGKREKEKKVTRDARKEN